MMWITCPTCRVVFRAREMGGSVFCPRCHAKVKFAGPRSRLPFLRLVEDVDCIRCAGTGRIPRFSHIRKGLCFHCGGVGRRRTAYGWVVVALYWAVALGLVGISMARFPTVITGTGTGEIGILLGGYGAYLAQRAGWRRYVTWLRAAERRDRSPSPRENR